MGLAPVALERVCDLAGHGVGGADAGSIEQSGRWSHGISLGYVSTTDPHRDGPSRRLESGVPDRMASTLVKAARSGKGQSRYLRTASRGPVRDCRTAAHRPREHDGIWYYLCHRSIMSSMARSSPSLTNVPSATVHASVDSQPAALADELYRRRRPAASTVAPSGRGALPRARPSPARSSSWCGSCGANRASPWRGSHQARPRAATRSRPSSGSSSPRRHSCATGTTATGEWPDCVSPTTPAQRSSVARPSRARHDGRHGAS